MKPVYSSRVLAVAGLIVLLGAACGDDTEPTPGPGRYPDGMVPPCAVESSPGTYDGASRPMAEAPRVFHLPAVRAGAPFAYDAAIPGVTTSVLRSGALPAGLTLTDGRVAGRVEASAVTTSALFAFEVEGSDGGAVEVWLPVDAAGVTASAGPPRYQERGPYKIWNTHPLPECSANPVIPELAGAPVPLYITYPAATEPTDSADGSVAPGRWPVVLFAHANNDRVCDIYERYFSLHDHWASWGYIVVAVDGTRLNCQGGSVENISDRTDGQEAAVKLLEQLDADPTSRFYGRVDLGRVVYAGHSRGGGASKWGAVINDRVRGVIDIQGVNYGFGAEPLPPVPVLGLTAGEDVDLNYPAVDPTEDHVTGPYTWVNINGGIHAYSADTAPIEPDDVPLISQDQQHAITQLYTTAFLARFVGVGDGSAPAVFAPDLAADPILFSHRGAEVVDAELSPLGVMTRWNRRGGLQVDDFPGTGDPGRNRLGGANTSTDLLTSDEVQTYMPGQAASGVFSWAVSRRVTAGASPGLLELALDPAGLGVEVGSGAVLMARVKGPDAGKTAAMTVVVTTTDGESRVDGSRFWGPEPLANRFSQLLVPLDGIGLPGAARQVISIGFEVSDGTLFIDDVRIE